MTDVVISVHVIPILTDYRNNESGRSVCLSVEPVVDQGQHAGRCFPERAERRRQRLFQSVQIFIALVAGDDLHLIPQPFDGIEFGTVGRQGQQMNPFWQTCISRTRMKARLIPDHHRLGSGITGGDLLEKVVAEV